MRQLSLGFLMVMMADQIFGHPDLFLVHLRGLRRLKARPRLHIVTIQIQHMTIQLAGLCEPRGDTGRIRIPKKALDHIRPLQAQFGSKKGTVGIFPHGILDLGQPDIPPPGLDVQLPLDE